MESLYSKTFLFLEFLSYLTYQEIARLRGVNKTLCSRIDNIQVWIQIIERDFPNLMILSNLTTTVSLSLLKNKVSHKELTPDISINMGVFGTLGIFERDIQEPEALSRQGFLGSMKEFVCNLGYCRFNIVAFPNVLVAKCQKKIIDTFLLLSKCTPGWEDVIKQSLAEMESIGIHKFVIGLRLPGETLFVEELRARYKYVVTVDGLTRENVKKMMKMLVNVHNDEMLKNSPEELLSKKAEPVPKPQEAEAQKKKCEVF